MLKKDTITAMEKLLGLEAGKLAPMIADESEVDLTIPTLYTEADKTTFGANRFKEGKTAGMEILGKEVKEKYKVNIEGKDIYKIVDAVALAKVEEAKLPANDQIKLLKADKEALQHTVTQTTEKLTKAEEAFNQKLFKFELRQKVRNNMPAKTTVPVEDLTDLFLLRNEVGKDEEGNIVVKKDGKVMQDGLNNNLGLDKVVKSFSEAYIPKSGMNGNDGKDKGGAAPDKFKSMSEFAKWAKVNDMAATSDEALAVLSKKKAEDFEYDEIAEEDM